MTAVHGRPLFLLLLCGIKGWVLYTAQKMPGTRRSNPNRQLSFLMLTRRVLRLSPGLVGLLGWWRAGFCLACCRVLPDVCDGEPCRADVACRGGWGPHTPCARQIGPHPPQPTPPSRHGSLRCVWVRRQQMRVVFCPRIPVQAHTGSHGQGVSRPTISARSVRRTAHPLFGRRAKQSQPESAEPGNVSPNQQSEAAPPPPPCSK